MVSFSLISAVDATTIVFIVLLVVLIVALLVVPMFTNKRRAKQTDELHNSLKPGDVVKTVGGIIGTIKEIRQVSPVDKEMVLETGSGDNKSTMTFDMQALYQVMSRADTVVSEPEKDEEPAVEEAEAPAAESVEPPVVETPAEEPKTELPEEEPKTEEEPKAEEAATEEPKEEEKPAAETHMAPKSNSSAKKPAAKKSTPKKK